MNAEGLERCRWGRRLLVPSFVAIVGGLLLAAEPVASYLVHWSARGDWSAAARWESRRRGDAIVTALKQYKADNGEYPESLGALIPKYLPRIDPPTAGKRRWTYKRDAYFYLGFEKGGGPNSYYFGAAWQQDDS